MAMMTPRCGRSTDRRIAQGPGGRRGSHERLEHLGAMTHVVHEWLSFPVPFALYLQQFGTRTCRFAWYLLHFGMVTLHFAWYLVHLAMFAFHFAWYLSYFGIPTSHLHGICYILVLQTFMWVS